MVDYLFGTSDNFSLDRSFVNTSPQDTSGGADILGPENGAPEIVEGYTTTNRYYNGNMLVTEYYDGGGWFMGASYSYDTGGGSWFTPDGRSGSWNGDTGFWSVGGALGFGLGIWGTGNGDWGVQYNAGIGAYLLTGQAESVGAAIEQVTDTDVWISITGIDFPTHISIDRETGVVAIDDWGFSFGLFAHESIDDGGGRTEPRHDEPPRSPLEDYWQMHELVMVQHETALIL